MFKLAALFSLMTCTAVQAQSQISWGMNARQFRERIGESFTLVCPPNGVAGSLWGNGTYTDDSSICTAAVHAGAITFAEGGAIILQMKLGQSSYAASSRNGVASQRWDAWDASFSVTPVPKPPPPPVEPPRPPAIPWSRTAQNLAPNGRRFTFVCRPPAVPAAVVKGGDLYSWDSSICNAALHAGAITPRGGTVTIEMRPGADQYVGSVHNGVTSANGTRTLLGFVVMKTEPR